MLKKILAPLFIILILLGWYNTIRGIGSEDAEYRRHMQKANEYEAKEIYIDALAEYKAALDYAKNPYAAKLKILDMYLALEKYSDFMDYGEAMLKEYDYPEDLVTKLIDYCMENQKETYAVGLLNQAIEKKPENEDYARMLVELRGTYTEKFIGQESLGQSYNGYFVYKDESLFGLLDKEGDVKFNAEYEVILPYGKDPEYAPVKKEGKWFYIDKDGYKKLVPDGEVDSLGMFGDGIAVFCREGLYGYADKDFVIAAEPIWEEATAFANKRALVCKDKKWALIDQDFNFLTEYVFEDVVRDSFGFATSESVFIAKKGEKYGVYDLEGNKIGNADFDMAKAFVSNEPAAVLSKGKWGFVGKDGVWKIEPSYNDADSFSNELAPVRIGELWGYIDIDNTVRIKPDFEEALTFSQQGYAPVRLSSWKLIKLIK